ncbi:MAG: ATP-binding protein [Acidimicrobiales bacterium]|nr:ATP-binding protein [Acidimicrobiales bacterium]HRW39876.1 ATP-binding protein [Aquihabitans sp.]
MHAAPDPEVVELALPARPEVVSVARLVVGAIVASDPLFDDERGADLRLAVSEACTNAIQAQLAADERTAVPPVGLPILMRCTVGVGCIDVVVTDHAGGFDPSTLVPHPEVTDPARLEYEGGLGIPLLRMLTDHVEFRPTGDGTEVRMRFEPHGDPVRG